MSLSATGMSEFRSGLTIDERLLLRKMRDAGMAIGGMIRAPWAYQCGFENDPDKVVCCSPHGSDQQHRMHAAIPVSPSNTRDDCADEWAFRADSTSSTTA